MSWLSMLFYAFRRLIFAVRVDMAFPKTILEAGLVVGEWE